MGETNEKKGKYTWEEHDVFGVLCRESRQSRLRWKQERFPCPVIPENYVDAVRNDVSKVTNHACGCYTNEELELPVGLG